MLLMSHNSLLETAYVETGVRICIYISIYIYVAHFFFLFPNAYINSADYSFRS